MSAKAMSLKAEINKYAKTHSIAAQVVLQNFMFERLLERLSFSPYKDKFVIKGGILIANIMGLDTRSTMDLDTTLRDFELNEHAIKQAIQKICTIELGDGVSFKIVSLSQIRKDDQYGGYCMRLDAIFESIITPLSIDISTGDVITPDAVEYQFSGIFDTEKRIELWAYNIETVMAEKLETILSRGTLSTRPRDYYDVYVLAATQEYNQELLSSALLATSRHRGTSHFIYPSHEIIDKISKSDDLNKQWIKYQNQFKYASHISFDSIVVTIKELVLSDTMLSVFQDQSYMGEF